MQEEVLLLTIETLHNKIISLSSLLWETERHLIYTQTQLTERDTEIAYLRDCIKHRDEEIDDLHTYLNISQDVDKMIRLEEENNKLMKKCNNINENYKKIQSSLQMLLDVEYTM